MYGQDIPGERSTHPFYTYRHQSPPQDLHALIPKSPPPSHSDTSSYHTSDFNHVLPAFGNTNHTDWRIPALSSIMDLELSGMDGQAWDTQQYPSSLPHISDPAHNAWVPELDLGCGINPTWGSEHNERRIGASASPQGLRHVEYPAGPAYNASHHPTVANYLSQRSINDLPPALPSFDDSSADSLGLGIESLDNYVVPEGEQWDNKLDSNYSIDQGNSTFDGDSWDFFEGYDAFLDSGTGTGERDPFASITQDAEAFASNEHQSKFTCSHAGCNVKFLHNADLTRHLKTIHNEAGKSYRCAFEGCSKAYKVWTRLDSFKKHVIKQHTDADVGNLVRSSRREGHGLPVSVTTPKSMSQQGGPKVAVQTANSFTKYMVT